MKKGFTLLELIIVIIIIGILATLAFSQYVRMVEKGRAAEGKTILGTLRTAQAAYYLEQGAFTATLADLPLENVPGDCTTAASYFMFACADTGTCTATRCETGTGKTPGVATAYSIILDQAGAFTGDAGR